MAPSNAQENSGNYLGHAANNLVGTIYNFIKFVFTALFCVTSFFCMWPLQAVQEGERGGGGRGKLYKLCKKEKEEEEVEENGKKQQQTKASSARKKIDA
jgi:hypothetical protein